MVNATFTHVESSREGECAGGRSSNFSTHKREKVGEFNWNQKDQGIILSSFFYGYILTQLPGGWLGNRFGGKWVFFVGMLLTSVSALLSPVAARLNIFLLVAVRVIVGIGQGLCFPAMHAMIAKWAPPPERTRIVMFAYSGAETGTIIGLPICSILADSNFLGGWPSTFYVFGILGIIWCFAWMKLVSNSPADHPSISTEEQNYITDSQKEAVTNTRNAVVPWKKFFTSIHVWAIIIGHFSNNWVWYLVLTGLPSYFKQVLNFKLKENGFLSALPFLIGFLAYVVSGIMADYLIKNRLTVTQTRRLMGCIAFYTSSLFLIVASFTRCDQIGLSVTCMVLGTGLLCFNKSGFIVNHLDIAPRYGGVLLGITNIAGTLAGCLTPIVTGYFTNDHPTRENYRKVFFVASGVAILGGSFFNVFVSGEKQSWNDYQPKGTNGNGVINNALDTEANDDKVTLVRSAESPGKCPSDDVRYKE